MAGKEEMDRAEGRVDGSPSSSSTSLVELLLATVCLARARSLRMMETPRRQAIPTKRSEYIISLSLRLLHIACYLCTYNSLYMLQRHDNTS